MRGGMRVPAVKKGMVSTDQILEEVVVTPKAAEKGKRVALVLGLQASEDVVQTKTLPHPHTSRSGCSTSRRFPSTITRKNTLISRIMIHRKSYKTEKWLNKMLWRANVFCCFFFHLIKKT